MASYSRSTIESLSDDELIDLIKALKQRYPNDKNARLKAKTFYEEEIHRRQSTRRTLGIPEGFDEFKNCPEQYDATNICAIKQATISLLVEDPFQQGEVNLSILI